MSVCEQCGAALDPADAFCGVCGGFTAWVEDTEAIEGTGAAEVREADGALPGADVAAVAAATPAADAEPAAVLSDTPGAVQPAVPAIERTAGRPAAADYVPGPDDMLCGACQTSNPNGRRFCRHCGARLLRLVPVERRSWWRRLLLRFAAWRRRRRLARKRGRWTVVRRVVALLVLCAGAGIGVHYALRHGSSVATTVQAHFAAPAPVNARTASASSAAPGHPAADAVDGAADTWWSPAAGTATGQWLQADFAAPHTLLDVDVMVGASQQQDLFLRQARPAALRLTATTADGRTVVENLTLADKTGFQQFHVLIPRTVSARLTIEGVDGAGPGRLTALAEVEFFAES